MCGMVLSAGGEDDCAGVARICLGGIDVGDEVDICTGAEDIGSSGMDNGWGIGSGDMDADLKEVGVAGSHVPIASRDIVSGGMVVCAGVEDFGEGGMDIGICGMGGGLDEVDVVGSRTPRISGEVAGTARRSPPRHPFGRRCGSRQVARMSTRSRGASLCETHYSTS